MNFLQDLNDKQLQAVKAEGPVIIKAGPGTGKTKTLVSRILYVVFEKKIDPSEILALTFTKKAAAEMKERLEASSMHTLPYISTFHGLAYDILKKSGKECEIITEKEQHEIIKKILKGEKEKVTQRDVKDALLHISTFKNSTAWIPDPSSQAGKQVLDDLLEQYNAELEKRMVSDYDDLLLELYSLLQNKAPLIPSFEHILVDEFQDTNTLQYEIVKQLVHSNGSNNLFVIGDPYQSIYSFRGADPGIFNLMKEDFPDATVYILNVNYRSKQHIVSISQQLFSAPLGLQSVSMDTGSVHHVNTYDEKTEAAWIISDIQNKMGGTDLLQSGESVNQHKESCLFADCAVIYRTHHIGRMIERWFAREALPYQMIGEESPFTKSYIQPIVESLRRLATEQATGKVSRIIHLLIESSHIAKKKLSLSQQLDLQQFISTMQQFDQYKNGLSQAVSYIDYLSDHEYYDERADKVTLLTMHAAKGLEFKYVYIPAFEEGIIPFGKKEGIADEEKRLLYVALTRAKEQLVLLTPQYRMKMNTSPSSLLPFLQSDLLNERSDEAIVRIEKQQKKWREKKSQMTLF